MNFPKFYVESDGDRVPKDVYICAGDGLGRIATIEGLSESTKFKLAQFIVKSCNGETELVRVAAQRDKLREALRAVLPLAVAFPATDPNGERSEHDAIGQARAALSECEKGKYSLPIEAALH